MSSYAPTTPENPLAAPLNVALPSTVRTIKQKWHVSIFGANQNTGDTNIDLGTITITLDNGISGIFQVQNTGPHNVTIKINNLSELVLPVNNSILGIVANSISIQVTQVADRAVCIVEADFLGA